MYDDDNRMLLSHKDKVIMVATKLLITDFFAHTYINAHNHTHTDCREKVKNVQKETLSGRHRPVAVSGNIGHSL